MSPKEPFSRNATIEYLRREAPFEMERLLSIGRLVSSWPEAEPECSAGDGSYPAWLRSTFEHPFGTTGRSRLQGAA